MHSVVGFEIGRLCRVFLASGLRGTGLLLAVGLVLAAGCGKKSERPVAKTEPAAAKPADSPAPAPATPNEKPAAAATGSGSRISDIDAIGERGSKGSAELKTLVAALDDDDADVRWHAARSIGLIGKGAASAIPKLVSKLADADPIVVTQSAAAIGRIRADDDREASKLDASTAATYEAAVAPLVERIVHPDPRVRRASLRSLEAIHPDKAKVIDLANDLLADQEPSVVFPALQSLADMGESAVPFLLESLDHPKAKYWATLALAEIGPAAVAAVPKLVELASKSEPEERMQAIMALAAIGEPAAEAAEPLVKLVASTAAEDRVLHPAAIYALGKIRAKAAFEPLAVFLDSDNPILAAAAAWSRARIEPGDAKAVAMAVERLRKGLASAEATVRQGAISAMIDLTDEMAEADAIAVAGELAGLLSDEDADVRRSAAVALVELGKPSIEPVTAAFGDPKRRAVAAEILGEIGPAASATIPMLVKALGDDDPLVRSDAAFAIASIGSEADEAVPALIELLDDHPGAGPGDDENALRGACYTAAYALGKIGAPA